MRNLATIRIIENIQPIPNADNIVVVSILGWKVVVKKGEFNVGDKCVYVEIDSILPSREEFKFLEKRKYRIKTVKLKGQISQGICFPMSILNELKYNDIIGEDVSEVLGIEKYETSENINISKQKIKYIYPNWIPFFIRKFLTRYFPALESIFIKLFIKSFIKSITWPSYFPKTDETRVQVLGDYLEKYQGTMCNVTEKLDGSSLSVFKINGKFGVCSRNLELQNKDNNWWKVVEKYNLNKLLPNGFALQGELIGPGIQDNKYKLEDHDVYFFNGYNIKERRYLSSDELTKLTAHLEVRQVPFVTTITLKPDIDFIVNLSIGKSQLNSKTQREGIVIRPYSDIYEDICSGKFQGNRISFKAINPEFLLKYQD